MDCTTFTPYGPGPWPGYGTVIPSLQQYSGGSNGTGTYSSNLQTVAGSFSTVYFSNLLDSCGYPTSTSLSGISTPVGNITIPPSSVAVVSTGTYNGGLAGGSSTRRSVLSILKWNNPYNYAFGSVNKVSTSGNLTTDSYNSDLGSYNQFNPKCPSGPPCGYDGNVGTDSAAQPALTIGGNAQIYGTAVVGLGGTVSGGGVGNPTNGWVQCDNCVNTSLVTLTHSGTTEKINNAATVSDALSSGWSNFHYSCVNSTPCDPSDVTGANAPVNCSMPLPPNLNYGNLTVNSNVYLAPGTYVFNSININNMNRNLNACVSAANPNAPVVVYLTNNLKPFPNPPDQFYAFGGSLQVLDAAGNNVQKAENFLIYGSADFTSMTLKSGGYAYTHTCPGKI